MELVPVQKKYFTIPDLCVYLNVTEETVRTWIRRAQIPYFKFGRLVRFDIEKIEKWAKAKEVACFKNQHNS